MAHENIPSEHEQSASDYEGPVQLTEADIAAAESDGDPYEVAYIDNTSGLDSQEQERPQEDEVEAVDQSDGIDGGGSETEETEYIEQVSDDDEGGSDGADDSGIDYDFAAAYGLSKEDADELGSQAAIEKFANVAAKQMLEVGKRSSGEIPHPEKPKEAPSSPEKNEEKKADPDKPFGIDLSNYNPDEYDDLTNTLVNAVKAMAPVVEQFKSQESVQSQRAEQENLINVQSKIDAIDPEFFGTAVKDGGLVDMPAQVIERRNRLVETASTIERGFIESGKNPPPVETLLRQAMGIEFHEHIAKANSEERKQRLTKQSSKRRPAGSRKTAQRKTYEDEADRVADDPAIKEAWERFNV